MTIFGEHYVVLPLSVHISNTETTGNLTLIKKNKFKTIYHSTIYINKNAVSVVNADDIDIYNIHLNDVSNVIRTKELNYIISTFNKNKKIIIGGDFNLSLKDGFRDRVLQDLCSDLFGDIANGNESEDDPNTWTWRSRRLDCIL